MEQNAAPVGITGIGASVPDRVLTNEDLERMVETSDEWIVERTGIRERRIAEAGEATSDLAVPAAEEALERASVRAREIDLLIVATASPDMVFPSTSCLVQDRIGAQNAAAYDLLAGCTGFIYALAQAYAAIAAGLADRALVVGAEVLSKLTNWRDRGTCILFGDGAGAAVLERVPEGGFLGFELGADGSGGEDLAVPAGGTRAPATRATVEQDLHFIRMNGREVYRFATRIMVSSAEALLEACGYGVDDVDVYVAHQANKRIIDHAARVLGLPPEKVVVNIDRYGNTSSASIPICLVEAVEGGAITNGTRVFMTGVGAGLTWGSTYMVWSDGR
ncbi:MAG: ketoacyl-ACP synthase III [Actinomycetota bacterium]|nr:ketoacyl-ACP synthase III [Actinomycetota bacterium]